MVGGEPVRIYLLTKNGMNLGGATASVIGERLIDALFMLICIPFALFILQDQINLGIIRTGIIPGIIVFIIFILLFIYAMKNPEKMKVFLCSLEQKISRIFRKQKTHDRVRIIESINREVDNFHSSIMLFVKEEKKAFLLAGLITILYWFVGFLIPSFILLGLGLPPYLIESFTAQMLLAIIVLLPITPGGSGVAEGGMAIQYGALIGGTHGYLLGIFVLLFRLISYHMNIIAGALFQYRIFKSFTAYSFDAIKKEKK